LGENARVENLTGLISNSKTATVQTPPVDQNGTSFVGIGCGRTLRSQRSGASAATRMKLVINQMSPEPQDEDEAEGRDFAERFRSASDFDVGDTLDQCLELADAAAKLGKAGLKVFCEQIVLSADSSLFKAMRIIGDRLYDFESERLDTNLLKLGFLALAPEESFEKLVEIASTHRRADFGVFIDAVLKIKGDDFAG
jgi:hypothetical protein